MNTKAEVFSILERNLPSSMIKDYINGIINEDKNMLYGFSFTNVNPERYHDYPYVSQIDGYSSWGVDEEDCRIYSADGCSYQYKHINQCLREGVYRAFSIGFYGYHFNNRWFIMKELGVYGKSANLKERTDELLSLTQANNIFRHSYFLPMELQILPDGGNGKPLLRNEEFQEFIGHPSLVGHIMQEEKMNVMQAHQRYLVLDVVEPFIRQLRATRFEEFKKISTRSFIHPEMIFSLHRDYILIPLIIINQQNEGHLYYFLWHATDKKMYQWVYFDLKKVDNDYNYDDDIIEDLSQLTYWNNTNFLQTSCTLNDDYFWQHYVLAKENNNYRHLVEVAVGPLW
jgi:hypothetical protein